MKIGTEDKAQVTQQPLTVTKILEVDESYLNFGEFDPRKADDVAAPVQGQFGNQLVLCPRVSTLQGMRSYLSYSPELNAYEPTHPQGENLACSKSASTSFPH